MFFVFVVVMFHKRFFVPRLWNIREIAWLVINMLAHCASESSIIQFLPHVATSVYSEKAEVKTCTLLEERKLPSSDIYHVDLSEHNKHGLQRVLLKRLK